MNEYKLYLAGRWCDTVSGRITDDLNPANGQVIARIHNAGPDEVEAAIRAAEAAQPAWAALLPEEREACFLRACAYMEAHTAEFIDRLIDESGSTFMKAAGEAAECVNIFRAAAGECRRINGGVLPSDMPNQLSYYVRQPFGVVGGIAPFNYPLLLALNKVAFALAAGNAMILKPSSDTPQCGLMIAECFDAAGLPAGLLSVLPGPGSVVGSALVEDPRIRMLTFTGSTAVGRDINVRAAKLFKKCTLEMGGKNPLIVLADYDIDKAVDITMFGSFFHQGQICMAGNRIIVEDAIYDEFCEKLLARVRALKPGDPHDPSTVIGPLINDRHYELVDAHIADAVSKGARLLCGGGHEGAYYEASLLVDVTPEMRVFREESFGPLCPVVRAKDAEDALRLCNDNDYGLSSALLTYDLRLALPMAARMEAGGVHINGATVMGGRCCPFGGMKQSGTGRENGTFSIEEFTELKWITVNYIDPQYPV